MLGTNNLIYQVGSYNKKQDMLNYWCYYALFNKLKLENMLILLMIFVFMACLEDDCENTWNTGLKDR